MKNNLKKCPFCKCEAMWNNSQITYSIKCSSEEGYTNGIAWCCYPSTDDYKTKEQAIEAWNTRAPSKDRDFFNVTPVEFLIKDLRELLAYSAKRKLNELQRLRVLEIANKMFAAGCKYKKDNP